MDRWTAFFGVLALVFVAVGLWMGHNSGGWWGLPVVLAGAVFATLAGWAACRRI